ncbi:hypothetical protein NDU88_003702 [Pleurodeles waltl]|uniref:Uncharacterized protein n=1 Tax=Pleurodeles waltl TaxID=8319 RepID=A0AAV7UZQ3_PLEWA|nr:hypothetical protein NDU88_003702 [Pleurodeles waltl]
MGGCCDELFETEVGEVVEQGGGVDVIGVLEVKVQVTEEDVVCRSKGVSADYVSDGVIELRLGTWGSVDECSSEGGIGVDVNLEVQVFGSFEGVFGVGRDSDGVPVDDGDPSSRSVGAVSAGDLIAVRDGYGDVRF